jgi:hypothetical protein
MRKCICLFVLILIFFLIQGVNSQGISKVGTSSANFLKIEVGAKASAMGGSFVSISNDLTSMYWNPAGLVLNDGIGVQFENVELFADISHNFAALAVPLSTDLMVGLSAIYLSSGDIEITTETEWDGTGQYYEVTNLALGLTFSRRMTQRLEAGVTVKYLREAIWRNSAETFAADFGLLLHTDIYGFDIGMSLTNVGPPMQMRGIDMQFEADPDYEGLLTVPAQLISEEWTLPMAFRVGISTFLLGGNSDFIKSDISDLIVAADISSALDSFLRTNLGVEYIYREQFKLRGGYRIGFDEITYSLGAGVMFRLGGMGIISFDYSYTDFGTFDGIHRFGIFINP